MEKPREKQTSTRMDSSSTALPRSILLSLSQAPDSTPLRSSPIPGPPPEASKSNQNLNGYRPATYPTGYTAIQAHKPTKRYESVNHLFNKEAMKELNDSS